MVATRFRSTHLRRRPVAKFGFKRHTLGLVLVAAPVAALVAAYLVDKASGE